MASQQHGQKFPGLEAGEEVRLQRAFGKRAKEEQAKASSFLFFLAATER